MPYYRCPSCGLTVHSAAAYSAARVCPDCAAELPRAARLFPTPAVSHEIRRVFAARPDAAGRARQALVALPVTAEQRDRLALLVSEIVTNAVRHAGLAPDDPISLRIANDADRVRVSVRDGGPGFTPPPPGTRDPLRPGGLGCVIVAAMSDAWGIERDDSGCTVWCELAIEQHPAAAAARQVTDAYVRGLASEMAGAG
jgi:anti-sigma regulatory factor (Ser/Thr protein kinase)